MLAVLGMMEELVEHLDIVRVVSGHFIVWLMKALSHLFLPERMSVILRHIVQNLFLF